MKRDFIIAIIFAIIVLFGLCGPYIFNEPHHNPFAIWLVGVMSISVPAYIFHLVFIFRWLGKKL